MADGLLDPSTVRALAAELDLRPTKQRGQNFVIDANTVRRIVALANVEAADHVLEIGPGLGSLTLGLLEVAESVTAIEIEGSLAARLPRTAAERLPERAARLRVIEADALTINDLPDPQPTVLVANLPYNVSVPVILHWLAHFPSIRRGLVMVQAEVADRLVAPPGSKVYGVPSAKLAWYASSRRVGSVPPSVFWPAPHVDSGLVAFERRPEPVTDAPRHDVFDLVDGAFAQRRKMLRSALSGRFGGSAAAEVVLRRAGIDPEARGEVLGIEDFARLAAVVHAGAPDAPSQAPQGP